MNSKNGKKQSVAQIFEVKNDKLEPNWKAVDSIFIHNSVQFDRMKLIVFCGLPRKGKSTVCNLVLHKLVNNNCHTDQHENVTFDPKSCQKYSAKHGKTEIENSFSISTSTKPHTNGIWITKEPLIYEHNGERVAIFIVDCQGVYGNDIQDIHGFTDQKIFVLGSLMASHLVYNVDKIINKGDEQLLITFLSSAKTLLKNRQLKPFQTLTILMRDWTYENEFKFGSKGGEQYYQSLRSTVKKNLIEEMFDAVNCFLMPEPNVEVKNRKKKLSLDDFGDCFCRYLYKFVAQIIDENDRSHKRFGDCGFANGSDFVNFVKFYYSKISHEDFRQVFSLNVAHSEITNLHLCDNFHNQWLVRIGVEYDKFAEKFPFCSFDKQLVELKTVVSRERTHITNEFRETAINNGEGVKNYFAILNDFIQKDIISYYKNVTALNSSWFMYSQGMNHYLKNSDDAIDALNNRESTNMHKTLLSTSCDYLNKNGVNPNGKYENHFLAMLIEKIEIKYVSAKDNAKRVNKLLEEHNKTLDSKFSQRGFFEINSSKWIAIHNEYCAAELTHLNGDLSEFGINFKDQLRVKATNYANQRANQSFKNETKVTIGGAMAGAGAISSAIVAIVVPGVALTFAGIGIAVVGVVGVVGAGAYVTWRHFKQPKLNAFH